MKHKWSVFLIGIIALMSTHFLIDRASLAQNNTQCHSAIAFVSDRDGNYDIYVMDSDGSNVRNLTNSPTSDEFVPVWSYDGKQIAFDLKQEDQFDIYTINADGSGLVNLTNTSDINEYIPTWSPKGDQISFASN